MKKIMICFVIAAAVIGIAKAQAPDPDTTARHFLIMTSIGNLEEVSSGRLASQKGSRTDVKAFGQMMVMDHGASQKKLLALVKMKGYNIPPEATGGIMADLKFKKATSNFDPLYVHAMVVDHRNTVQMFQNYAITGKDPDVRAFARQMLPILKQHLQEIKVIDMKIDKIYN